MTQAQRNYEKILNIGVIILLLWHMLMSLSKVLFASYKAEMAYAAVLALSAVIYLVLCRLKWTKTEGRIKLIISRIRTPNQIICVFFFIWFIISLLVNRLPHFQNNIWLLFDVGINCLFLFNLPMILPKEKCKKLIDLMLHTFSIFGLCLFIYGLWHLFTLNFVHLEYGEIIGIAKSFNSELHFELGCYYNSTAAFALSLILIALYMIASQKTPIKICYAFTLIPYSLALFLTNSRSVFIACVAAGFGFVFLVIWNNARQKPALPRLLIALAASSAAAVLTWQLRPLAFRLFESVTNFSAERSNVMAMLPGRSNGLKKISSINAINRCMILFSLNTFFPEEKVQKFIFRVKLFMTRAAKISLITAILMVLCTATTYVSPVKGDTSIILSDDTGTLDQHYKKAESQIQSGEEYVRDMNDLNSMKSRQKIWEHAAGIIRSDWKTFLFGVTPLGFDDAWARIYGAKRNLDYTAHNELLNMGVSLGVPMMILLLVLFIITGIKGFRLGFLSGNRHFHGAYVLPLIFAVFVLATSVEAYLFASFTPMSCLFFLSCGWINALDKQDQCS